MTVSFVARSCNVTQAQKENFCATTHFNKLTKPYSKVRCAKNVL